MPNDKSAVEEFLGSLGQPKEDPFKSDDPFAKADEPKTEEEGEGKKEEKLDFHKDPKVQKYIEKRIAKALEGVKPAERIVEEKKGSDDIMDSLVEIVGNDTPEKIRAIERFHKSLLTLEEKGAQRALQQLQEQTERAREEDVKAQRELDESFEEIEETYNVDLSSNSANARKMRSEFIDYVRKIAPKDRETGEVIAYPDMQAAFEDFQERTKRPANRAKDLASRGMTRSGSGDTTVAPTTDKSWKSIDKLFSKLSG